MMTSPTTQLEHALRFALTRSSDRSFVDMASVEVAEQAGDQIHAALSEVETSSDPLAHFVLDLEADQQPDGLSLCWFMVNTLADMYDLGYIRIGDALDRVCVMFMQREVLDTARDLAVAEGHHHLLSGD